MATIKTFNLASLESISDILGETSTGLTGTQISKYLAECNISDPQLNSTKRKRLYDALALKQNNDKCANNVLNFLKHAMHPSRHIQNQEWFFTTRNQLNVALSFEGLELTESGDFKQTNQVKTFSEAEERAKNLRKVLLT